MAVTPTGGIMVIDTSRCIGCKACQVACQQWHMHTDEDTAFTGSYQNPPDMSPVNYNVVKFTEIEVNNQPRWLFFKDMCRHCEGAPCRACPLLAIRRTPQGVVLIDPAKCNPNLCSALDTKPCQLSCPYNVPKYKYVKNGSPVTTEMRKCDFCFDAGIDRYRHADLKGDNDPAPVAVGGAYQKTPYEVPGPTPRFKGEFEISHRPACLLACPPDIMYLGMNWYQYARAAYKRANYLKANGYPNANVYPEQRGSVWGPTHVMWVLLEDPSVYGLPVSP